MGKLKDGMYLAVSLAVDGGPASLAGVALHKHRSGGLAAAEDESLHKSNPFSLSGI